MGWVESSIHTAGKIKARHGACLTADGLVPCPDWRWPLGCTVYAVSHCPLPKELVFRFPWTLASWVLEADHTERQKPGKFWNGCVILQSSFLPALSIERGLWHQSWMFPGLLRGSSKKIVVKALCQFKINIMNNYFVTFLLIYTHIHTVYSKNLAKALLFFRF